MRLLIFNLATDADDPVLGFTTTWINALAKRSEAVDVVTMRAGRLAVASNVDVYSVGKEKGYGEARRALEFYRTLIRLTRTEHYDACFAHMMPLFAVMAAPVLKAYRVPITLWYSHKATGRMLQTAERLVDHVVTSTAEGFRLPSKKVQLIGQGIDTDLFAPAVDSIAAESRSGFTLVSVGRIAPVKRLEIIISAVKALHEQGLTDVRLRLVGEAAPSDDAYDKELRTMAADSHLSDAIIFVGGLPYETVREEYQRADVMVNMSDGSLDKALLEAMACGVPVVTANEAFETTLKPWADLLYIPPESSELLPLRLRRLAEMTAEERTDLGATLRALVVDQHSITHLTDRLFSVFTS
ncbi:MAG TPA: glycosyltransferase family 4 protein [Acidimicrobiales bacterium]|nr:glycosyltransferase family 4 protein [Acidimicrobiales bacterium]